MKARRVEALLAMARQDASPHERDIARAKLTDLGVSWASASPKAHNSASPNLSFAEFMRWFSVGYDAGAKP